MAAPPKDPNRFASTILDRRVLAMSLVAFAASPARAAEPNEAVDVRTFGAVGDGKADDTAALKRAHASGTPLIYPKTSGYFRTTLPLDVKADVLGRGGELRIHGDGRNEMELLRVGSDAPPLTISGMTLDGEYETGAVGEWSHGIALRSARKVRIVGNTIRRPYGDCIYVGVNDATKLPSADIVIENNQLQDPRRCCVAVISADRVRIAGNHIDSRHNYVAAIDIEPNPDGVDRVHGVTVQGNQFNVIGTFLMVVKAPYDHTTDVIVRGNRGQARVFLEVGQTASMVGGVVEGNEFTTDPNAKGGVFLLIYGPNDLRVEGNRDLSPCGGSRYISLWPSKPKGLVLRNNTFCRVN